MSRAVEVHLRSFTYDGCREPVLRDWLHGMERFTNDGGRTWLPVPACSARVLVGSPE